MNYANIDHLKTVGVIITEVRYPPMGTAREPAPPATATYSYCYKNRFYTTNPILMGPGHDDVAARIILDHVVELNEKLAKAPTYNISCHFVDHMRVVKPLAKAFQEGGIYPDVTPEKTLAPIALLKYVDSLIESTNIRAQTVITTSQLIWYRLMRRIAEEKIPYSRVTMRFHEANDTRNFKIITEDGPYVTADVSAAMPMNFWPSINDDARAIIMRRQRLP